MKEQFEERRLVGKISVKCKNDDGTFIMWNTDKATVVSQIVEIVDAYKVMGYTLTLRQLHYQFVTRNWIVNHQTAYKKLGKILDDCRYGGVIDWDAIEDRGRRPVLPYYCADVAEALSDTLQQYRVDRQAEQETHVEVWTEKDALSGILSKVCSRYHIRLAVNKGYTSSSAIYDAYERFAEKINDEKKVVILYFGDHDPSGLDMVRDIRERLELMYSKGEQVQIGDFLEYFEVIPIGLSMQQIKQYNLPHNPAKLTDTRADAYIKKFGKKSWEVDALNPEVLVEIVQRNIEANIDLEVFAEQLEREVADKKTLEKFIKNSKK